MTSVVPERDLARPELRLAAPATWSGVEVVSDTRWLRQLGRRLFLLDAVLVTIAVATTLLIRYSLLDRSLVINEGTLSDLIGQLPFFSEVAVGPRRLSVYVLVGPLLALAWTVLLVFTRAYDGKVLGVGGDEYRRVARASVYFWGLVAIASYMAQFELSRFVLASPSCSGPSCCSAAGGWPARCCTGRAGGPPAGRTGSSWSVAARRSTRWWPSSSASPTPGSRSSAPACPRVTPRRAPRCRWSAR